MKPGVLAEDFHGQRAGKLAAGFHHVKFREPVFEVGGRGLRRQPEGLERGQVIHGGAPDLEGAGLEWIEHGPIISPGRELSNWK